MMASLGSFTLLVAFVVCSYAAAVSVAGARRRSPRLIESGVGAFYLVTALMLLASAVIVHAFVTEDYSIRYVDRYSDSAQPLFYKITSYWGGLDGSIMFWVTLLSMFGASAVYSNRERQRELIPYVVAVIAVVEMFFLFLMIVHTNPFATYLTQAPVDGQGLNPLLQNAMMVIHPPALYTGFVGMTIPFAFALAALITGHLDDSWLRAVRRWTMMSWLFLSLGLTLGMLWAYEELGWGGYWGWDPVENAALLPWFTATAFLHSVMVQERRSMLRVWNMTLVIMTFFLTIFGTFMTRSGIVQSIHAFGQDTALAWMFTVFMVALLTISFGLVIYRLPLLRARNELESWVSREAAFLVNNWILLFSAVFVLFATMFPTLSEAVTGARLTVGPPFYTQWMLPIGFILLILTGVGPLLAWRRSTVSNLLHQFTWPVLLAVATMGGLYAAGFRVWVSGLCFGLCAFVCGSIGQEFVRGAYVRRRATGTDIFTALIGLVARSRRRYGGNIVHVGIVLMFLGFAGSGYKLDSQLLLRPGQETEIGRYTVRYDRLTEISDARKQMITAYMTVLVDGETVAQLHPARWYFFKHEDQPTTEVAMRHTVAEDLYIVLAGFDMADQAASFQITVNPLVNWIWIGFSVLALGTVIALLPESAFAFAGATAPRGAATASMLLLAAALSVMGPVPALAQPLVGAVEDATEGVVLLISATRASAQDDDEDDGLGAPPIYEQLREAQVEHAGQIRDGRLQLDRFELVLTDGHLYLAPEIGGIVSTAVFLGDGLIRAYPPDAVEYHQFEKLADEHYLEDEFDRMVLRFTDDTADRLRALATPAPAPERETDKADSLVERRRDDRLKDLLDNPDSRVLEDLWRRQAGAFSPDRGYLLAEIDGKDHGWLTIEIDPNELEEVHLSHYDGGRRALDIWMGFDILSDYGSDYRDGVLGGFAVDPESLDDDDLTGVALGLPTRPVEPDHEGWAARARVPRVQVDLALEGDGEAQAVAALLIEPLEPTRGLRLRISPVLEVTDARWRPDTTGGAPDAPLLPSPGNDDAEPDAPVTLTGEQVHFVQERHDRRFEDDRFEPWVTVALPRTMEVGERFILEVAYEGELVERLRQSRDFLLKDTLYWRPRHPDNRTSQLDVRFRVPDRYRVASAGSLREERVDEDTRILRWVTDAPLRGTSFHYGEFDITEVERDTPPVVSLYANDNHFGFAPGNREKTLEDLTESIAVFTDYFGPFPFDTLLVAETPTQSGQAFPGLLLLSYQTFGDLHTGESELFRRTRWRTNGGARRSTGKTIATSG